MSGNDPSTPSSDSAALSDLLASLTSDGAKKPWESQTIVLGLFGWLISLIPNSAAWIASHPQLAATIGSTVLVLVRYFVKGGISLSGTMPTDSSGDSNGGTPAILPAAATSVATPPPSPAGSSAGGATAKSIGAWISRLRTGAKGLVPRLAVLLIFLGGASTMLTNCSTTAGVAASNILDAPATQQIVKIGIDAAASELLAKTGNGLPSEAKTALVSALTDLANNAATSTLSGIAGALAGKGTTAAAADSGQLIAAQTSSTDVPVQTALKVALVPSAIVNNSAGAVTPADANAALVSAVRAVALQRTKVSG